MAGLRPPSKKPGLMRPPSVRPSGLRAPSVAVQSGRESPADSILSLSTSTSRARSPTPHVGGVKRKERDFDGDGEGETNINVVVRCRGRSDREVRENSGVVVSTDGIRGRNVELSMGPSALSNKTYHFDKVFSQAADQSMIFDDVVAPILDEVLSGFNCTIFAYGQTGTGKTYTMSGDISDTLPLPDGAGIIPRVLYSLFSKLEADESETSVKCSFIELYNEELRDLLAADDNVKLKIYEDNSKKGQATTLIQGMEESHIKTASKGIHLLRQGSHKRQVAATKCNDLSSRSHTVFTVTVYMKRTTDTGEDFVSAGKLNLVDLAGSENIQRSGAENKRAAEAGLINKSLLTLGRVINALVDKGSHIPYRESKLTRLLQDSLGGRTKTCIIATLSPAKSNLEETISTLDYAFRAKNIRNKPQINQMVSKKTLLKEFTSEIEKLKSELIATRQRNGVYLTQDTYEEMTTESESRRILSEEQRDKIETLEINLRNKLQDIHSLTTNFATMKKDNEATKLVLEGTKSILEKTEVVLAHTRQNLEEETEIRKAHQTTEENLANIGQDLLSTLGQTTSDIDGLRSKIRRKSDLQTMNRKNWAQSRGRVSSTTIAVEDRIEKFRDQQEQLVSTLSSRMQLFVQNELQKLEDSQSYLREKMDSYTSSEREVNDQTAKARDDMNEVLEEIKTLREDVKQKVGAGLNDLSAAAQRITAGIVDELDAFQTQIHESYSSLGREFKTTFENLSKSLNDQQLEANELREQIVKADRALIEANQNSQGNLSQLMQVEKEKAAEERKLLLAQVTSLINASAEAQEQRIASGILGVAGEMQSACTKHSASQDTFSTGMDRWTERSRDVIEGVAKSKDNVKKTIKADFAAANDRMTSLRSTTTSVHDSTVHIVEAQMGHMDTQLQSLDSIVTRLRDQNNAHHAAHTTSLGSLAATVQSSYDSIGGHLTSSFTRVRDLDADVSSQAAALHDALPTLSESSTIRSSLRSLREELSSADLAEYAPTGETPRRTEYAYPTALPRTESRDGLLARLRGLPSTTPDGTPEPVRSPTKGMVFNDPAAAEDEPVSLVPSARATPTLAPPTAGATGLRELDVNVLEAGPAPGPPPPPLLKRQNTNASANNGGGGERGAGGDTKLPMKMRRMGRATVVGAVAAQDRENAVMPTGNFSASVGAGGGARRLRTNNSG